MSSFEPLVRNRWFVDQDGAFATPKRLDEIIAWSHDWTDALASGETISSAAYVDSGTTRTNVTAVSPITAADVAGVGEFEVTVTLSTGRKLQRVFRFYDYGGSATSDYK